MGASILPVTVHNGRVYFLFGKERTMDVNPGWSDFGGGTDPGESLMQSAVREGVEELTGFLGSKRDIERHMAKYGTLPIDHHSIFRGRPSIYRCHVYPIAYDPNLCTYFNSNRKVIQAHLTAKTIADVKIFEKTKIEWFTFDDIRRRMPGFRVFYRKVAARILEEEASIRAFLASNALFRAPRRAETRRAGPRRPGTRRMRQNSTRR